MCTSLDSPLNGQLLSTQSLYHFGDTVHFQCNFGYIMLGSSTLTCTSGGNWNGTIPTCQIATCPVLDDDATQGLAVRSNAAADYVVFQKNVTVSCNEVGRPLRDTATAGFRQCVYNPADGRADYWLSGAPPECRSKLFECFIAAENCSACQEKPSAGKPKVLKVCRSGK